MISRVFATACAIACAVPAYSSAASVRFEGEWSVSCGKSGYQCFWTIEKHKGAYQAYFTAADHMNVEMKRCTDGAKGKASGKGLDLVMAHGGYRLSAKPAADGSIVLKPIGGWHQDCGGFNMFGTLSPIGY